MDKLERIEQIEKELAELKEQVKAEEPETYRGWIPKVGDEYYYSDNTGYVGEAYANDPIETEWDKDRSILGVFPTEAEAKATYGRHMAGEECKKIISKWINELAPGWKLNWKERQQDKYYLSIEATGKLSSFYVYDLRLNQDEWHFPKMVAYNEAFKTEVEPHFRKWLGVE